MKTRKNFFVGLIASLVLLMAGNAAYANVAGHVQFVNGAVQMTDPAGQTRSVQKGDTVNEGDTLTSARNASAQIRMQDGGMVAMRPDTRLKFDRFIFSGKQDGTEQSFFSLFKGGFRAVTGLIGQINKPSYRITTPVATIGIRGTDHETFMVAPDSELAAAAPQGAYNKVNLGETYMATEKGTIFVLPNQMGFAGAADQMPQLQPINTNLFTVAAEPTPQAEGDTQEAREEGVRETAVVDNTAQEQVAPTAPAAAAPENTVTPNIIQIPVETTGGTNLTGGAVTAVTGVYPAQGSILGVMTQNTNPNGGQETWTASSRLLPVNFDANGILTIVDWCQGCTPYPDVARITVNGVAATSFDAGADAGVVSWGRWSGGDTTFGGWGFVQLGPDQGFHFVAGFQTAVLPTTNVTARYNMIGATAPTNNLVAGLTTGPVTASGFLDVNFSSQATSTQMDITSGNGAFQIVGTGTVITGADFSMNGTTTRTGGAAPFCTTACPTNMVGSFFGVDATHAGIAYRADATGTGLGGGVIDGAAVFKK